MTEVWGQLAKAQDDNQTIDEAIAVAVSDHEADPEAHLDADESLQSHKLAEIIDHRIGSVVADKMTMTELTLKTTFESLDKWQQTGTVDNNNWYGFYLWSDYDPSNPAMLNNIDVNWADYIDWSKNIIIQCVVQVKETIDKIAFWGHGFFSGGDVTSGFGFKLVDDVLYGYLDKPAGLSTVELADVDVYSIHNYRAQWDATTKKVTFYVDGVEKGNIEWETPLGYGDGNIIFRIEATETGECYLLVYEMYQSRQI